jgi:RNA polymerase sigma-70 factor (ECF subfamily)
MAKDTNPSDGTPPMAAPALTRAPGQAGSSSSRGAPEDDEVLVGRAQRGDRAAFGQLFRRHHGRVRAMCVRLLGNPAEVDDTVQQTFLEAWRCLGRFEGRSRFTTWITRVAIHTCFSTRRRLRRLLASEALGPGREVAAEPVWAQPGLPPDEAAARRRHQDATREVLQALSPKKRAVFVLADIDGLSSTEIAEILEVPDATVRTRLYHARREVAALVRAHPAFVDVLEGRGAARGEGGAADDDEGGPR